MNPFGPNIYGTYGVLISKKKKKSVKIFRVNMVILEKNKVNVVCYFFNYWHDKMTNRTAVQATGSHYSYFLLFWFKIS